MRPSRMAAVGWGLRPPCYAQQLTQVVEDDLEAACSDLAVGLLVDDAPSSAGVEGLAQGIVALWRILGHQGQARGDEGPFIIGYVTGIRPASGHPDRTPADRPKYLRCSKTGIPWKMLPAEIGCGSGTTCWRHLKDWQQVGVWRKLHETLLTKLEDVDRIDWQRASVDSARVAAPKEESPRDPTQRIATNTKLFHRARSAIL